MAELPYGELCQIFSCIHHDQYSYRLMHVTKLPVESFLTRIVSFYSHNLLCKLGCRTLLAHLLLKD